MWIIALGLQIFKLTKLKLFYPYHFRDSGAHSQIQLYVKLFWEKKKYFALSRIALHLLFMSKVLPEKKSTGFITILFVIIILKLLNKMA